MRVGVAMGEIEERFFDCVCRPFVAECATNGRRKTGTLCSE
jgi:hypothetical protein